MDSDRAVEEPLASAKQQEILDTAAGHFLRFGYEGTSVNNLTREARISKESVYRYYRSKQKLFEAVIARELAEYQRELTFADSRLAEIGLEQALREAGETILSSVCTERVLALRRLIFQQVKANPEIGTHYYAVGPERAYSHLEALFARHAGSLRLSPARLARHYVALLLHADVLRLECGMEEPLKPPQVREHVERLTAEFLDAFFETDSKETER